MGVFFFFFSLNLLSSNFFFFLFLPGFVQVKAGYRIFPRLRQKFISWSITPAAYLPRFPSPLFLHNIHPFFVPISKKSSTRINRYRGGGRILTTKILRDQ